MSSQICCSTLGSIVVVSRLSGAFSEYTSSVTLPQCGPIASAAQHVEPFVDGVGLRDPPFDDERMDRRHFTGPAEHAHARDTRA